MDNRAIDVSFCGLFCFLQVGQRAAVVEWLLSARSLHRQATAVGQ
jgi:hypothetical protein